MAGILPSLASGNIMKGPRKHFNLPQNLGNYLLECLAKQPVGSIAMVDSATGTELTAAALVQDTVTVAQWLRSQGIAPGFTVGFCAENRLEYAAPMIATLAIGATCGPLNPIYTVGELKHTMSISEPSIIFCSPSTSAKLTLAISQMSFPCKLVVFDKMLINKSLISYNDIVRQPVDVRSFKAAAVDGRHTVAALLCSSGTTGLPKCVELTHANLTCFVEAIKDPRSTGEVTDKDVILGLPPFFHGFGFGIMLFSFAIGIKIVAMPRYTDQHFLETIQNYKVTLLFVVPPILVLLAKYAMVDKYDLSSLRLIRCGAAPLSKEVQQAVCERLNLQDIEQAYGMTELAIACVFVPQGSNKIGSSGVVTFEMECKIVDLETGQALPPGKQGELCFRGPFLMKGYKKNKKATDETIDKDGWLHTGDIGYSDLKGYLYVVDRLKELIKYKGFQVAPAELEAVLLTNPAVKSAAVIGIPDEKAGELPFAFVVLQPKVKLAAQELLNYVSERVSAQKRLSGGIRFVEDIPKNPTGKILRRELRTLYKTTSKL